MQRRLLKTLVTKPARTLPESVGGISLTWLRNAIQTTCTLDKAFFVLNTEAETSKDLFQKVKEIVSISDPRDLLITIDTMLRRGTIILQNRLFPDIDPPPISRDVPLSEQPARVPVGQMLLPFGQPIKLPPAEAQILPSAKIPAPILPEFVLERIKICGECYYFQVNAALFASQDTDYPVGICGHPDRNGGIVRFAQYRQQVTDPATTCPGGFWKDAQQRIAEDKQTAPGIPVCSGGCLRNDRSGAGHS